MTFPDLPDFSKSQWNTPYLKISLQFLALTASERRNYLPYTFDGRTTLDNGYLIECDDPMELMLLYLREVTFLPELWEHDPEFTLLSLSPRDRIDKVITLIADLQNRLEGLTELDLQANIGECQEQATTVLTLLGWPIAAPETPATEILDTYTYGGFSKAARPVF
ncbi:hypothetical protein [Deinococcus hopiensis]|uniref:Uncharacterized protein n=1 Tax=Deinococcus hopiensis KR-140 TaxID=695939 RepID=A0A1W1UY21_9DEIO|nr:hypothetical protein [Deinococcus hopiensis]SMB85654.1 hypothetical protein SAMN00790413_03493 [Deinococcus hopiensis KR-140]